MSYQIERFPAGPLDTNGYLIIDGSTCLVVDPSLNSTSLIFYIKENKLSISAIVLTHGHFDHFLGIYEVWEAFGKDIPLYLNPDEEKLISTASWNGCDMIGDERSYKGSFNALNEGIIEIDTFTLTILETPGHTPGGVCVYDGRNCLTGDTLFAGSVGRSDWGYSDGALLNEGIKTKLYTLSDDTIIWPGHAMRSTIGREKKFNSMVR